MIQRGPEGGGGVPILGVPIRPCNKDPNIFGSIFWAPDVCKPPCGSPILATVEECCWYHSQRVHVLNYLVDALWVKEVFQKLELSGLQGCKSYRERPILLNHLLAAECFMSAVVDITSA